MSNIINGKQAKKLIASTAAQLLDVRTQEESSENPVAEATLIPLDKLLEEAPKQLDSNRPVIIFCRSGRRSKIAIELLKKIGFQQLWDMESYMNWGSAKQKIEEKTNSTPDLGCQDLIDVLNTIYKLKVTNYSEIHRLLIEHSALSADEELKNDHIAFRCFDTKGLNIEALEQIFLDFGYSKMDFLPVPKQKTRRLLVFATISKFSSYFYQRIEAR